MPPSTRAQKEAAFKHLLETVFGWTDKTPAYVALKAESYDSITDLTTMDKAEIDELSVTDATNQTTTPVPSKQRKQLYHALLYYDYEVRQRASKEFNADDWLQLTANDFDSFCETKVPLLIRGTNDKTLSGGLMGVTSGHVSAFDASQKQHVKSYNKFNSTLKMYFRTMRQWKGQARVDNVSRIFDDSPTIPDKTTDLVRF